jgi:hypothetical protein
MIDLGCDENIGEESYGWLIELEDYFSNLVEALADIIL